MNPRNELKKYGLRPSKRLGQHFLINQGVLKRILQAAELKKTDTVLEIGPGTGILTIELAKTAKKVIAIEKDQKICQILKESLKCWNVKNVEVVNKDILKTDNLQLTTHNYKVVANIPYYITSPLIRKFLEEKNQPKLMVLMVQKEVAQRICSKPPDMNLLAVSVQFYAEPKIIGYVSKKSFWPKPKVDSAIIKISNIYHSPSQPPTLKEEILSGKNQKSKIRIKNQKFFKVVKAGFSHPRKQLLNNLSTGLKIEKEKIKECLKKIGVNPEQRAESLSLDDWLKLTEILK